MHRVENTSLYIKLVIGIILLSILGLISKYYIQFSDSSTLRSKGRPNENV